MNEKQFISGITPIISKYVPEGKRPWPKQMVFMGLKVLEAGFGGSAGSGKSEGLLMDACQGLHIPGYKAAMIRRTFADLSKPGALMDRAYEWFKGTNARWVDKEHKWRFPTEGKEDSQLAFGYMDTEKDKYKFQSSDFQFVGFDEATHMILSQYTYMFSRIRYTVEMKGLMEQHGIVLPLKMRSGTNPGGIGHVWYKNRFMTAKSYRCQIHPDYDGISDFGDCSICGEVYDNHHRIFLPASIDDNPSLDKLSYVASLKNLDPITRAQLLSGNWDVTEEGAMFNRMWFTNHEDGNRHIYTLNEAMERKFKKVVRFWDLAGTKPNTRNEDPDYTAGALVGIDEKNDRWVLDIKRIRDNPGAVKKFISTTAKEDYDMFGDMLSIRGEMEPGSSGKFVAYDMTSDLGDYDIRFKKSTGSKFDRAKPVSASCYNGHVNIVAGGWNGALFDELESFSDELDHGHDDQVDGLSGAWSELKSFDSHIAVGKYKQYADKKQQQLQQEDARYTNPSYLAAMERGRACNWHGGV